MKIKKIKKTSPAPAAPTSRNDKVWQIGNTGFRNPERLTAITRLIDRLPTPLWVPGLVPSQAFAEGRMLLAKAAVAARSADPDGSRQIMCVDASMEKLDGVGKALMACFRFGLMKPLVQAYGMSGKELFTDRGRSFLAARTDRARRVVFARALAHHEVSVRGAVGRPLLRIAQVIMGLADAGQPSHLTAAELGWCVLTSPLVGPVDEVVGKIIAFREDASYRRRHRESRADSMGRENAILAGLGLDLSSFKRATLLSYADVTARHLLFTGMFVASSPRSLSWDRRQEPLWRALAEGDTDPWSTPAVEASMRVMLEGLLGEALPARGPIIAGLERLDDRETTHRMAEPEADARISSILRGGWAGVDIAWDGMPFPISEIKHAAPASAEWALAGWMHRIHARSGTPVSGTGWRGRADVMGRPECCAPGGDADAILDTASSRYVLEATLLTGSRQSTCEGESVLRHVATASGSSAGRQVWGLFSAPAIDAHTLFTFMAGGYALDDDTWVPARVIPLDFTQVLKLHEENLTTDEIESVLARIWDAIPIDLPAPEQPKAWRQAIASIVGVQAPPNPRAVARALNADPASATMPPSSSPRRPAR